MCSYVPNPVVYVHTKTKSVGHYMTPRWIMQTWLCVDIIVHYFNIIEYRKSGNFHAWKYSCVKYSCNKFSWVPYENILTWKFCQLHIIEVTVHALLIMTNYLDIATTLVVLQRKLSAVSFHTDSFKTQSNIIRLMLHWP